jgi:hypothetical protein
MIVIMPADFKADLAAWAKANALSPGDCLRPLIERELRGKRPTERPLKSHYGVLAKYGPAPSAYEIDENRREMFRNFPCEDEW